MRDTDDEGGPIFRPASLGLTRTAVLPVEDSGPTRLNLEPDPRPDQEKLAGHLLRLVADQRVREAVEVSSSSLAGTVEKVENGEHVKPAKLERGVLAAARYLLRMTGRPTPFGLLAGVQLASFGAESRVRIGRKHRKRVTADSEWLSERLAELHHDNAVRERIQVATNNLCTVRGNRLVLPHVRSTPREHTDSLPHEMTVAHTAVVRAAVENARIPVFFGELRDRVQGEFPEANASDIERLLIQLVDREILLTDLLGRQDEPDQLRYVNRRISEVRTSTALRLGYAEKLLSEYESTELGRGRPAWRSLVTEMGGLHTHDRPPAQVDLDMDARFHLPAELAEEATRAADVLWRLGPPGKAAPLVEYHARFLDRYGTDQVVPLPRLLDPHRGLGPPDRHHFRQDDGTAPESEPEYSRERDQALATAVHAAGSELVLDDHLVETLGHGEEAPPQPSLDLCVQPLAPSVEALRSGEFRIVVTGGGARAGGMAGRFAHVLGAEQRFGELYEETAEDSSLNAQVFFQPSTERAGNITRMNRLMPRAVAVGCFPDAEDAFAPEDLAVGACPDRLYLVSLSTGREVTVTRTHLLNLTSQTPDLARLLIALGASGTRVWTPWQWGRLEALPHLPRVSRGRSILALERWRADPALRDPDLPWDRWQRALREWRERLGVPDRIRAGVMDQQLDLDLTVPLHQRLLRGQLRQGRSDVVREQPSTHGSESGWSGGHATEVVVPMLSTRPRSAIPDPPPGPETAQRHTPGGEWLYARIYAAREHHDALLQREIAPLLGRIPAEVDRWFFVRYADPDPHVRLRVHAAPQDVRDHVLPVLHEWSSRACADGTIGGFVLDTYEPETSRYGGPEALEAAERLFAADSRLVLEQLRNRSRGGPDIPLATLAAMNYVELLDGLGDWDWQEWVLRQYPAETEHRVATETSRAAAELVDPARRWQALRELGSADDLLACWARLGPAVREYGVALKLDSSTPAPAHSTAVGSVLHMHANRLLGPGTRAEPESYGILRTAVRRHRDRLRHQ
ncbi:thiopeptide-type bacteriocin biosynthesis protein [Actinopolyspora lacussalsi]|nr:thiopeptide-type bacteriocin biosynthesis protein [Actinopolyspora lacussalsi]